jgi:nitrite reductase/ring-hydroxylating ferredoxin subunit
MDKQKEFKWFKIAGSITELSFSEAGLTELEVNGKKICLSLYKEILYACTAKCPHASGTLSEGYLDSLGNIVCPIHRYKFNLQNGRNNSGEGYFLKTYPVEQREEGIFIGIEKSGLLGWLK